jgi:hypothetical protein
VAFSDLARPARELLPGSLVFVGGHSADRDRLGLSNKGPDGD